MSVMILLGVYQENYLKPVGISLQEMVRYPARLLDRSRGLCYLEGGLEIPCIYIFRD